jgi:hypothetical protein
MAVHPDPSWFRKWVSLHRKRQPWINQSSSYVRILDHPKHMVSIIPSRSSTTWILAAVGQLSGIITRKHSDGHVFPSSLPSGKLTVCYWKWWFMVDFPIESWFSIAMLIYWRIMIKISMSSTCADAVKQIPQI